MTVSTQRERITTFDWWLPIALLGIVTLLGCESTIPPPPIAVDRPVPVDPPLAADRPEGTRVTGRIVSTAWRNLKGGIERAIVTAWSVPESVQVAEFSGEGEAFQMILPAGEYRLVCSAVGTRGATFEVLTKTINVGEEREQVDIGPVDLPLSKTTRLYGQPAPQLDGIIGWQDTPPLALGDLKGKVVVLDFFAYYCSICHAHKPDLVKLREKYNSQGLVVLAIHDSSLPTLADMNEKMGPALNAVFKGLPPRLPIALDGNGAQSVFSAYGIQAVPAVILIDQQGKVVRRYHHAGKHELESDVQALLTMPSKRIH